MSRRGSAREARNFLSKAEQYLDSAIADLAAGRFNPSVSNAVVSAINASDVIGYAATGSYNVGSDHDHALALLRKAGPLGREAIGPLQQLLPLKNLAQYRSALSSKAEAESAVALAEKLFDVAKRAASTMP